MTKEAFEKGIAEGKFLEHAYVHNNIYGTSVESVKEVIKSGRCCILDIDVQGARQVRASGIPAIFVFIAPPSVEALEERLRKRGTETEEQIAVRLENSRKEIESINDPDLYDHIIINNDFDACFEQFKAVASRALSGEVGVDLSTPTAGTENPGSPQDPSSAAISLKGWLRENGSPLISVGSRTQQLLSAPPLQVSKVSSMVQKPFDGCVALVVGIGGPAGWASALGLLSLGIKVAAVSKHKSKLEALQQASSSVVGITQDLLPVVCDFSNESEVESLVKIIRKHWPGSSVQILINCLPVENLDGEGSPFLPISKDLSDISNKSGSFMDKFLGGSSNVRGRSIFGDNYEDHLEGSRSRNSSETFNQAHSNMQKKRGSFFSVISDGKSSTWADNINSGVLGSVNIMRVALNVMKHDIDFNARNDNRKGEHHSGHIITIFPDKYDFAMKNNARVNQDLSKSGSKGFIDSKFNGINAVVCEAVRQLERQVRLETSGTGIRTSCINIDIGNDILEINSKILGEAVATTVWWCLAAPASIDVTEVVASLPGGPKGKLV